MNNLKVMGLSLIGVAAFLFIGVGIYVFVIESLPLDQSLGIWLGLLIPLGLQSLFGVIMLKKSQDDML